MNELNKKEEEIKGILGGLEIGVDTNDIWANIESELPQQEKKRRYGFLIFIGLLGLGILALSWNYFTSDHQIHADNIIVKSKTLANENAITISENININSTQTANNTSSTKANIVSAQSVQAQKTNKNKSSNAIARIQNKTIDRTAINHSPFTANRAVIDREEQHTDVIDTYYTSVFSTFDKKENTLASTGELFKNNIGERIFLTQTHTPTLSSQLLDIVNRQPIESTPQFINPSHTNGRQLILQLKLGVNQNRSTISDINSIGEFDSSEFDFERDRLGVSGSIAIGVENNGWRFLAGAAYHHHVSTYERADVFIYKNPTTGVEYYRIDDAGQTTTQNGTTTVTLVRDNDINFHRQHRAIDFYASVGRRLWSYKGLVLMADVGLGINTITHSNGYYIADEAFGLTKITDDSHPYQINTHWNAIASLEIGYNFGKTRVGLSPFIRYNPNTITSQTHLYTLKNSQVGMQLSLTYTPTRE